MKREDYIAAVRRDIAPDLSDVPGVVWDKRIDLEVQKTTGFSDDGNNFETCRDVYWGIRAESRGGERFMRRGYFKVDDAGNLTAHKF